jgi:TatA/E family protein of Tat protein translocase
MEMKSMFKNIGFTELLLIAIVALVLFGPKKLPEIGRVLGRTLRDFKQAANELMKDEPKAPIVSNTPVVPDPITPVAVSGVAVQDDELIASITPSQEQGSMNAEVATEPINSPAVKPAVAFVTNKSSEVVQVTGTSVETEELSSPATQSALLAANDVLSNAPAHASAPTPAPAQQPGSTSNSRRLPD